MSRTTAAVLLLLGAWACAGAIGRVHALQSLSPPDLAFFHQATWSAAQGHGFSQTALEFDAGTLTGSIHLSLVRALWVPLYALLPAVETLVALQAVALTAALSTVALTLPRNGRLAAVLVGLHPLSLALADCDLRPLTFVVAPALLVVAGLMRKQAGLVALGAFGAALAREEAPLVLAALVPFAVVRRQWRGLAVLVMGGVVAAALPWAVWGHGRNITANSDLMGTLDQIQAGQRPWVRWPVELQFGGRALVAAWPALLAPELLVPGLLGWGFLVVFSELEPAAPGQGGLHYLSVVAPLLLGAAWVGLPRAVSRLGHRPTAWLVGLGLLAGLPEHIDHARWVGATPPPPIAAVRAQDGAVLSVPEAAPLLSGRPTLRILGHFQPTEARVAAVCAEVDHAVLPSERPPEGPPAAEWDAWHAALPAEGLRVVHQDARHTVWAR